MKPAIWTMIGLFVLGNAGPTFADELEVRATEHAYALVVGSNPGGQGQETLRYAEEDAARVARVLRDLGGYRPERARLLIRPTPEKLLAEIAAIGELLAAEPGEETIFFFYYSGHARASALNLGEREMPLEQLRQTIAKVPAKLTVVVLDACQSGAFSRIKGAQPAADFSFNSVRRLDAAGMAVMASSTGSELSQESEQLRSSYFTHYLLVALRGAGDSNRDGRVTLDEAYRYAYHATLASTAKTAVGSQHVTLETDLKGKGEVPLTYLNRADAKIELPEGLAGEILIQSRASDTVVAELHKAPGRPTQLALPQGSYRVLIRHRGKVRQCDLALSRGQATRLRAEACASVAHASAFSKGPPGGAALTAEAAPRPSGSWAIELGVGLERPLSDGYTDVLDNFGYNEDIGLPPGFGIALAYQIAPRLQIVGELSTLDRREYTRGIDSGLQRFSWYAAGLGVYARGVMPLGGGAIGLYAQAGGGPARGSTTFLDTDGSADNESFWGFFLSGAAGIQLMPWQRLGFYLHLGYEHAPIIDNLIGDVHDSGGMSGQTGLRFGF